MHKILHATAALALWVTASVACASNAQTQRDYYRAHDACILCDTPEGRAAAKAISDDQKLTEITSLSEYAKHIKHRW